MSDTRKVCLLTHEGQNDFAELIGRHGELRKLSPTGRAIGFFPNGSDLWIRIARPIETQDGDKVTISSPSGDKLVFAMEETDHGTV